MSAKADALFNWVKRSAATFVRFFQPHHAVFNVAGAVFLAGAAAARRRRAFVGRAVRRRRFVLHSQRVGAKRFRSHKR